MVRWCPTRRWLPLWDWARPLVLVAVPERVWASVRLGVIRDCGLSRSGYA
jgi:hypothetical protein